MNNKVVQTKDEENVLHILHELAKKENVSPTEWLTIRIMRAAKKMSRMNRLVPSKPKVIFKEKLLSASSDERVYED